MGQFNIVLHRLYTGFTVLKDCCMGQFNIVLHRLYTGFTVLKDCCMGQFNIVLHRLYTGFTVLKDCRGSLTLYYTDCTGFTVLKDCRGSLTLYYTDCILALQYVLKDVAHLHSNMNTLFNYNHEVVTSVKS